MAGNDYKYRGYYTPDVPRTDGWSKTSYDSDHVCRPVIIDAAGRKRPIVSFSPHPSTESCATRTEVVQYLHSPVASDTKYDPRFSRPDSSWENYGVVEDKWLRPPSPVRDRPPEVDDFISKVQTEASRPRFDPLSTSKWRQTPTTTNPYGHSRRYSENNDWSSKERQKHKVYTNGNENNDDYFGNYSMTEPSMTTSGGWVRPSHATWGTQPDSSLSTPTSDIDKAMRYLEEAAKPYPENIDSRAYARRYGNYKFSTRP